MTSKADANLHAVPQVVPSSVRNTESGSGMPSGQNEHNGGRAGCGMKSSSSCNSCLSSYSSSSSMRPRKGSYSSLEC